MYAESVDIHGGISNPRYIHRITLYASERVVSGHEYLTGLDIQQAAVSTAPAYQGHVIASEMFCSIDLPSLVDSLSHSHQSINFRHVWVSVVSLDSNLCLSNGKQGHCMPVLYAGSAFPLHGSSSLAPNLAARPRLHDGTSPSALCDCQARC